MPRPRTRPKYTTPCDACSAKKIRCIRPDPDLSPCSPCSRCMTRGITCTTVRVKKKCGPKTRKEPSISTTLTTESSGLPIAQLLPCIQIYQTWYYGTWPVISGTQLISSLIAENAITATNASLYALCCSLSAAICAQVRFLKTNDIIKLPADINAEKFIEEAIRTRESIDYRFDPTVTDLLTSFFFYIYYINVKNGTKASILYLREAICTAQILGLHDPKTYEKKLPAECHRLRKIFYMLLVTERYVCIENSVPAILEASIPYPLPRDEEYPELLDGFSEIVKVFALPDRAFFDKMTNSDDETNLLKTFLKLQDTSSMIKLQNNLSKVSAENQTSDIQKVNILLSKHWLKSIAWHVSFQNGFLGRNDDACLAFEFPQENAHEFLATTAALPIFAFESQGTGGCVKLLEIANGLADAITVVSSNTLYDTLTSVFSLVSRLKNDVTLPVGLYNKLLTLVTKRIPRAPQIEEIDENDNPLNETYTKEVLSPFSEMLVSAGLSEPETVDVEQLKSQYVHSLSPF